MLRADRYHNRSQKAVEVLVKLAIVLLLTLLFHGMIRFLMNRTAQRAKKKAEVSGKTSSAIAILPLLKTLFVFMIWGAAILASLSILGFNVGAILAGLGIGGIAIAMASKETLSDIIGGISIFLSGSFKIGDTIMFKGQDAEVEEIGVRYTRLRANASKFQISVPNSQLAQGEVVNISRATGFTVNFDLPLSIRNSAGQIGSATKLISEIIGNNPDAQFRRVRFSGVANCSFILSARYIINDFSLRHSIRTEVYTEIVRQFQQNHIEFAAAPYFRLDPYIPESQPQISEIAQKAERV
jgi:MscS family membrane protein